MQDKSAILHYKIGLNLKYLRIGPYDLHEFVCMTDLKKGLDKINYKNTYKMFIKKDGLFDKISIPNGLNVCLKYGLKKNPSKNKHISDSFYHSKLLESSIMSKHFISYIYYEYAFLF